MTDAIELSRDDVDVVRSAPRYDPRIDVLVAEIDDVSEPMAEICRRVCAAAERLGLTRPSTVHLRTLVRAERDRKGAALARRDELLDIAEDVAFTLATGRLPNAYVVADRVAAAALREKT